MAIGVLLDVELGRTEVLNRAVELARQTQPDRFDLNELISACLDLPLRMKRLNDATVNRVVGNGWYQHLWNEYGDRFRAVFEGELKTARAVVELVARAEESGADVERAGKLREAVREAEELFRTIFDPWPFFRKEDYEQALEEVRRGEGFIPIEDIIRDLQRRV